MGLAELGNNAIYWHTHSALTNFLIKDEGRCFWESDWKKEAEKLSLSNTLLAAALISGIYRIYTRIRLHSTLHTINYCKADTMGNY